MYFEFWYVFNIDHPILALPNSFNPTGVSRDSTFWALHLEVYVTREVEEGEGQVVEATNATDHTEIYRDALMPPYATLCHLPVSSPIHTYSTYIHLRYATYTAYAPAGSCLVLFGLMRYACRIVSGFPSSGSFEALLRSWRLRKAEEDRGHLTPETMETTQMLVGVLGLLGGGGHQTFSSDSL